MRSFMLPRLVTALVVLVTAVGAQFLEPIKQAVWNRYDCRWALTDDKTDRSREIGVCYRGNIESQLLLIQERILANSLRPLSDFKFAEIASGAPYSFMKELSEAVRKDPLSGLSVADRRKIKSVLDWQSTTPALHDFDQFFESLVKARPRESKKIRDLHASLRQTAGEKWEGRTKVKATFTPDFPTPIGLIERLDFIFELKSGESRFLQVHYGPDPAGLPPELKSDKVNRCAQVEANDLRLDSWRLYRKYGWGWLLLYLAVACVVVIAEKKLLRPDVHEVFNSALAGNEDAWEVAFKKHSYYIIEQFQQACDKQDKKDRPKPNEAELLGHVRYRLQEDYDALVGFLQKMPLPARWKWVYWRRALKFKNKADLNRAIISILWRRAKLL